MPDAVREAIEALKAKEIEGLVLDLRNNSGGLVSAGLAVADDLLAGEIIVETQDRNGIAEQRPANPGTLYSGPMVTLINGGTASASEILAGALQDNSRSQLLGSTSFGKGEIQTLMPLGDGSGLAVTVARYLTPNGRPISPLRVQNPVAAALAATRTTGCAPPWLAWNARSQRESPLLPRSAPR